MKKNNSEIMKIEYNKLFERYGSCLDAKNLMAELRCGKDKVYRLFEQKSFPSFKLDGRYMITTANYVDWINKLPNYVGGYYTDNRVS